MSYCLYADVRVHLSKLGELRDAPADAGDPPATVPSLSDANDLVDQIAAEIDGRLRRRGVTLPVIDEDVLAALLPINANGAAAAILRSAFPRTEAASTSGGTAVELEKKYQASLKDILDGLVDRDAAKSGANVEDGFPRHDHDDCHGWGVRW